MLERSRTSHRPTNRLGVLAAWAALLLAPAPASLAGPLRGPAAPLWQAAEETQLLASRPERRIVPRAYGTYRLDREVLRAVLDQAPLEPTTAGAASPAVLTLPMPDGTVQRFTAWESPIMEAPLAANFPEIRTFSGQGIDDPSATVRFDWTPDGFHAMVISASRTVFVDPYGRGDTTHYITYDKRDFEKAGKIPRCLVGELDPSPDHDSGAPGMTTLPERPSPIKEGEPGEAGASLTPTWTSPESDAAAPEALARAGTTLLTPVGATLRRYRLALAADGEYTQFHGGTVSAGLSAVVTTVNRVTGVYERELSVRLVLVANETSIIYTNPNTDPYTNSSPSSLLSQNQSNLDSVIGTSNYDIGHVFSTGGGGLATLSVVCNGSTKARGETGSGSPVGDPFDIDYVAHEMGHQFGALHSFNGTTSSCGGSNRSASSAYEPGSGSTIMAYAGICGAEDLQPHSDDYFHTRSFDEIVSFLGGAGGACATSLPTGNSPPAVSAGPDFTIPIGTPFVLTASASDPDGDPVTYCWEEFDLGTAAPPNTDDGSRPIFRSFNPVPAPSRTFPRLQDILSGTATFGESLPVTNRTMSFRATARDNRANGGGVNYALTHVTSTTAAGPFVVTQPNTALSWAASSSQTVTWNVAGTAAAPVGSANVRITLSTDGGNTYPSVLSASTPNDGSQAVTIPNLPSETARIKVEGLGNVFFDVSNVDFTILPDPAFPYLRLGPVVTTPVGSDGDAFVEPGEAAQLSITLRNDPTVAATATNVTATLVSSTPGVTVITTQPVSYADLPPGAAGANTLPFQFTVSSAVACGQPLSFTLTAGYSQAGGPAVRAFTVPTGQVSTATFAYTGPVVAIPDNNATGANATLAVGGFPASISDLNFRFDGTSCSAAVGSPTVGLDHTYVGDLVVRLTSPLGTVVTLMNRPGGANTNSGNNFCQTVLDDSAASSIQSIAPAGNPWSGTFQPNSPLSAYAGQNPNGVWTLNVTDLANVDVGNIREWSLDVNGVGCSAPSAAPGAVPESAPGAPLAVSKSGGDLTLSWGASCSASGVDYAIYQGSVGAYTSHVIKFCTTGGLLTRTFPADPGDLYFLVVPLTADNEGSYGRDGNMVERPPAASACKPQLLSSCP